MANNGQITQEISENSYIICNNDTEWLGKVEDISNEKLTSSTTFNFFNNSLDYGEAYSAQINENGGLTSVSGDKIISQKDTMQLVGGMDNYNSLLEAQGKNPPIEMKNLDVGNGTNEDAILVMYDNGSVYVKNSEKVTQLDTDVLNEYWPNTHQALQNEMSSRNVEQETISTPPTEETNSTQEEIQTETTSENSQYIEAGKNKEGKPLYKKEEDNTLYYRNDSGDYIPYTDETNNNNTSTYTIGTYGEDSLSSTGKATTLWQIAVATGLTVDQLVEMNKDEYPSLAENPNLVKTGWVIKVDKSQVSTDNKPPEEPNTGGSTVSSPTIKIDFENIETTITTLSSLYNNITELIDSYTGEISGLNSSTVWQGEDKESLIEVANGEYLSYLSATKDNLQKLISQLEGKRNQFRDAETALSKLTI